MRIERRYTKTVGEPYAEIEFRAARSEIRNPDGSVVFCLENFDVPAAWSQVAADVLAQNKGAIWINHDKVQRDAQKLSPQFYA